MIKKLFLLFSVLTLTACSSPTDTHINAPTVVEGRIINGDTSTEYIVSFITLDDCRYELRTNYLRYDVRSFNKTYRIQNLAPACYGVILYNQNFVRIANLQILNITYDMKVIEMDIDVRTRLGIIKRITY